MCKQPAVVKADQDEDKGFEGSSVDPMGMSLAEPRLCLAFEFELDEIVREPSSLEHDKACKKAATELYKLAGVRANGGSVSDPFKAKAQTGTNLTISKVHNMPFDLSFHVPSGGPVVCYEFVYDQTSPKMFFRVVTSFNEAGGTVDGVMASRIGLHTIEILEGNQVKPPVFPKTPPIKFTLRHICNMAWYLGGAVVCMVAAHCLHLVKHLRQDGVKKDPCHKVNSVSTMLELGKSKFGSQGAVHRGYMSTTGSSKDNFKSFLAAIDLWRLRLGLTGYMAPINFSPIVSASMVDNISDVCSLEARHDHIFVPIGSPPNKNQWKVLNSALASRMILNNYGRHEHNFSARPKGFLWDWLHMGSHIHVAGCISINGTFFSFLRSLEADLGSSSDVQGKLGMEMYRSSQNRRWIKDMSHQS